MTDDDMTPGTEAEQRFDDWFRTNYPGPDTIMDWHSPRVFRAATVGMMPRSQALAMVAEAEAAVAVLARAYADALAALDRVREEARREERLRIEALIKSAGAINWRWISRADLLDAIRADTQEGEG